MWTVDRTRICYPTAEQLQLHYVVRTVHNDDTQHKLEVVDLSDCKLQQFGVKAANCWQMDGSY